MQAPPSLPKGRTSKTKGPVSIDRSDWKKRLCERNPEILNIKQSIHPWERLESFVDIYEPGRNRVKQQLSHEVVVKLVLQHLTHFGFHSVREVLAKESGIDFEQEIIEEFTESRLLYFFRYALKDCEQIYNVTLDDQGLSEKAHMQESELEELLINLELMDAEPIDSASENINIWDEPEEGSVVMDSDNQVKTATLNKVVELITSQNTEMSFVNMFLVTYQSFTTPETLFSKLMERLNVPDRIPQADANIIRFKVGNVLRKWIEESSSDFSPELVARRDNFIRSLEYTENKTLASLGKTLTNAVAKAEKKDLEDKIKQYNKASPAPKINMKRAFAPQFDIFTVTEEEIARQLCLIEFRLFSKIRPSELLNQSWSKAKYKHRAMNVLRMINRFNTVSMWVATSILKVAQMKQRAKLMTKFIKIGEILLHNLHNFNGTMAIIAGLNWSSIHRLSHTRREVPVNALKALEEMERILSSDRSFQSYRQHIAECDPPCIPYLGVYLTDLTFLDENPDFINGQINLTKRRMVYGVISKIQQYQQTHYNLQPVDQIISQLLKVNILDETTLYNISLKREPRNAKKEDIL